MNRQEKQSMVTTLRDDFLSKEGSFLIGFQGMNVEQVQVLRKLLRAKGGKMQVAKARLMRIASEGITGIADLAPYFKYQVALVFADKEATAVAKLLVDTAQQNEKLIIIAGCMESRLLNKEEVRFVASLPSREVLLAQLAGVLQVPTNQFVIVLNQLLIKFLLVLKAIGEKKQ